MATATPVLDTQEVRATEEASSPNGAASLTSSDRPAGGSRPRSHARTGNPRGRPRNDGKPAGSASRERSSADNAIEARINIVKGELQAGMIELGAYTMFVAPITGVTIVKRGSTVTDALGRLAAADERILVALEKLVKYSAVGVLAGFAGTVLFALGVDRGVIPLQLPPVQMLLKDELEEVEKMQQQAAAFAAAMQQAA